MSSAEAEYVAAAGCYMVPIFCDNTSAIAISNNPVLHSRTKHIDIRYHFIKDHILKGDIELHFVPTDLQLADIFTKPLAEPILPRKLSHRLRGLIRPVFRAVCCALSMREIIPAKVSTPTVDKKKSGRFAHLRLLTSLTLPPQIVLS
ncbi:hypothetical protein Tco_1241110 [Tanacetum coccineum]